RETLTLEIAPMAKTLEERQKIARMNGSKSRGPTSTTGKAASARNSCKLGIYARIIPLADEDPDKLNALRVEWYDYVKSCTPSQRLMTEDCYFSDIVAERTRRAHVAAIEAQGQEALDQWHQRQRLYAEHCAAKLGSHTLEASAALRAHSHGCLLLIA